MVRSLLLMIAALGVCGAGFAQTPAAPAKKVVIAHADLRTGRKLDVSSPQVIDGRLCGEFTDLSTPGAAPQLGCVSMSKFASVKLDHVRYALADSIDGSFCMAVMPLCFAKVKAVEDKLVRHAIEKAKTR